jgi:hypothetical protein
LRWETAGGEPVLACAGAEESVDCNDADPSVQLDATDIPNDEVDQDCDGTLAVSYVASGCATVPSRGSGWLVLAMGIGARRRRRSVMAR